MRALISIAVVTAQYSVVAQTMYENPVGPRGGDPGAAYDSVTGAYYFATTSVSAPNAFPIWKSTNLVNWTQSGAVFPGTQYWPTWAQTDFWAPEFHRLANGRWVVYFAARNKNGTLCVGVATSTPGGILGPYVDLGVELVYNATPGADGHTLGNIDPTFFLDDDGQHYLIYKADGNDPIHNPRLKTPILLVKLAPNGTTITSTPTQLITNDQSWEGTIVEAPWLVKRAGAYYLFYSGAGKNNYAVGVATATAIAGPYTKRGPPILHTNASSTPFQGTGHCSVIDDPRTGGTAMLYHSWPAGRGEMIMLDTVHWPTAGGAWPTVADGSGYPSQTVQVAP